MFKYFNVLLLILLIGCASSTTQSKNQLLEKTKLNNVESFVTDIFHGLSANTPQADLFFKIEDVKFMDNYSLAVAQIRMKIKLKNSNISNEEIIFIFLAKANNGTNWIPVNMIKRPVNEIDSPVTDWKKASN